MKRVTYAVSGLLLVLGLILGGCGQQISAEEIVAKMRETLESTQDAHAVLSANVNAQGVEMSAKAEVWEKAPNKLRLLVLEASDPTVVGELLVSDGQQVWYYQPAKNRVTVGKTGEVELPLPQELLGSFQEMIQQVLDASDVELQGEEVAAGREAYKLAVSPKEGSEQQLFPGNGTATLWVDKEQWFPLKAIYEGGTFGQGTMEVQSFELNPGLAEDLFQFTAPEGTQVEMTRIEVPEPLTLDEAKAQALFPLLVPGYVPAGATLVQVLRMGSDIYLEYSQPPDNRFSIVQSITTGGFNPTGGLSQQITIRGYDATLITDEREDKSFLRWIENGVLIAIAGSISPDEAIQVAESLQP